MKSVRKKFRKGTAILLACSMVAGLVTAMPGNVVNVKAAGGSLPSVSAYATKEQLMDGTFAPNSNGTADHTGKLVFGKKQDDITPNGRIPQEWYILGQDTAVPGENTIIFATTWTASRRFYAGNNTYNYEAGTGYGASAGSITVNDNHYGASNLREGMKSMAEDTSYFTEAEQKLMNYTTVTTKDELNNVDYTTRDKLYAPAGAYGEYRVKVGTNDQIELYYGQYWYDPSKYAFLLRSPFDYNSENYALVGSVTKSFINIGDVGTVYTARPASNLNLSSVLFASSATAASSSTATSEIISQDPAKAMTLRLDGSSKNIGFASYNTTTGDIRVMKGSTKGDVALVVQGNDGTNDWYYSKQITGTEYVNAAAIEQATDTPESVDLSACKIWLETTDSEDGMIYAVDATEVITIKGISSVAITGFDPPSANTALSTSASCETEGVSSTEPQITWTPNASTAGYNTSYTASITLTADVRYEFTDTVTATVLGNKATSVKKNADGTLTVTYDFPKTAKVKLIGILTALPITVANGTAYDAMNLPKTVSMLAEGRRVMSARVSWDTTTPVDGKYDPAVLTKQTVTLKGTVECPENVDPNGVSLTTTITITISAAGIVGAPTVTPAAGTYTENQSVTLTSSTEGATIYYTTDGSEPALSDGVPRGTTEAYTAPIPVTGTEGQSVQTQIKAIAVKNGMRDSKVEAFTFTIEIPDTRIDCEHENTEVRNAKNATCTEAGYTGDTYCMDCEKTVVSGNEIPMKEHQGGTATCKKKAVCSVCGQEYGAFDAKNHVYTEIRGTVSATCTGAGYTGDTCCKDCDEKIKTGTATKALGHDYVGKVTKEATTDSEGTKTYTCSRCGDSYEESIPKGKEIVTAEEKKKNSMKLDMKSKAEWKGKQFKVTWGSVEDAEGYDIFAAQCGKKMTSKSLVKTVNGQKSSVTLAKIGGKKPSGSKSYMVQIQAFKTIDGEKVSIGTSKIYHVAGKNSKTYTNAKKVKVSKKSVTIKKGKTSRIKATIVKQSAKKKLLGKSHGPALRYDSTDTSVATVTAKGKIKAKGKGTCYIYVTALNGVKAKVKVTVK